MKSITKMCLFTFAMMLIASAVAFAASDAWMGTWKLNEAKSKLGAGGPKNDTVTYEAEGDQIKVTIEGMQGDGTKTKTEWTGKFDGKDYPSTGNPNEDMRSVKQVNARTLDVTSKKGDKVVLTAHVVVSADGKTRKVTASGTGADGKKWKSVAIYDKQ